MSDYFAGFLYGISGRANKIRIDASSMCQLECPICVRWNIKNSIIGNGYLKFEDFKKFVDKHPSFKNIELSNSGEMFLNPELKDIIRCAYIKNINLTAYNGVNLNTIDDETIECLVKYRFKCLVISIDGANGRTYKIYRKGGNFHKVIEHIKKINCYKKIYNTEFPKLVWKFIIFGHNEHELPIAKKMAKALDMNFLASFNFEPDYSPIKDKEIARREMGYTTREEMMRATHEDWSFCRQLWAEPQINWDGKLLGCCCNMYGYFGNVFEIGLRKCLKSEKYIYTKRMLVGKKKPRRDIPCVSCVVYQRMQSENKFLEQPKLRLG